MNRTGSTLRSAFIIEHADIPRNYSLSDSPVARAIESASNGSHVRQPTPPDGLISNYLHDKVQVGDPLEIGPPCGEFTLAAEKGRTSRWFCWQAGSA